MAHLKCYIFDFFYYLLFAYLIYHVVSSWHGFEKCDRPLNIWLLVTFGFYIIKRILIFIMTSIDNSNHFKYVLALYLVFIYPTFMYWTIHGTIWTVEDSENVNCTDNMSLFWLIYLCLVVSYVLVIMIFAYAIYEIIHFYRMRRIRRRIEDILNNIDVLLASNAIQNLFENGDGNQVRNELGLTESEKTFLKPFILNPENSSEFNNQDCSICIEQILENDTVMVLPGCKHSFHSLCIFSWLERNPFCPNCKANIRIHILEIMKEQNV